MTPCRTGKRDETGTRPSKSWLLKGTVCVLFIYGLFSSIALLQNNLTDTASAITTKDTYAICPDFSKLSKRQENRIQELEKQNQKLVSEKEELRKNKSKRQENRIQELEKQNQKLVLEKEELVKKKLERQENRILELENQIKKLAVENEALVKKHKAQQQQAKEARFDLLQLRRNSMLSQQEQTLNKTALKRMHNFPRYEPLNLIETNHLHLSDYMADCWLMNRTLFLGLKPPPEIAGAQTNSRPSMFVDWMDFSVEHMSHLWNVLDILNSTDPTILQTTIELNQQYLKAASRSISLYESYADVHSHQGKTAMEHTIAMIAFQPMMATMNNSSPEYQERSDVLTSHSLASTIASLYQIGVGRLLVVGYRDNDIPGVQGAFRLVDSALNGKNQTQSSWNNGTLRMKNGAEIAYVRIRDAELVFTRHIKVSMVRGCIVGMQKALTGGMNNTETRKWLGDRVNATDYWRYVYLSEPDTILHTKPWLLPSIRNQLDHGMAFYPHRIQPLPHESNFPSAHKVSPEMFLPKTVSPFSNVTTLDPLYNHQDSCCDGGNHIPGRTKEHGKGRFPCDGYWWWACGFFHHNETVGNSDNKNTSASNEVRERHMRLLEYPLARFKDGSGLVWGSNERGRRCFPSKSACPIAIHIPPH